MLLFYVPQSSLTHVTNWNNGTPNMLCLDSTTQAQITIVYLLQRAALFSQILGVSALFHFLASEDCLIELPVVTEDLISEQMSFGVFCDGCLFIGGYGHIQNL